MPIATLLNLEDPNYVWDHDRLHRQMLAAQANPAALTPILDPATAQDVATPAGLWQTQHATAHADFAAAFPSIQWPSTAAITDLTLTESATEWWGFQNLRLHMLALTVL